MGDTPGIGGAGGPQKVGDPSLSPTDQTWSVDQESKTIHLDNGYTITIEGKDEAWTITDPDGNKSRIWGDPHVHEGDGGKWDFKADMTFELEDGTKITVKTKEIGDGSVTVSDELYITKGDQCVTVTGLAANNPQINDVTMDGQAVDAAIDDGYVAREMGGVDDWSFAGDEITHNLPFVDYEVYVAGRAGFLNPPGLNLLDIMNLGAWATSPDQTDEEIVDGQLNNLKQDLQNKLAEYEQKLAEADTYYDKRFYQDLVNATRGDIQELTDNMDSGTVQDKVELFNRVTYQFHLEVKFNINLTSNGEIWSQADLQALDAQLSLMPSDFTTFNDNLREIRMEAMAPGVGGYNTGSGLIAIPPGGVQHAMVHEVGHDFDNENPRWDDFLALSGWENVSGQFSNISSDFIGDTYSPYSGSAKFSDGNVYHDGDPIDLDGDGTDDGIVQVHYGQVWVHDDTAAFNRAYAGTNPKDDFAEVFRLFFQNPQDLQNMSAEKYDFMVDFVGYDPLNP